MVANGAALDSLVNNTGEQRRFSLRYPPHQRNCNSSTDQANDYMNSDHNTGMPNHHNQRQIQQSTIEQLTARQLSAASLNNLHNLNQRQQQQQRQMASSFRAASSASTMKGGYNVVNQHYSRLSFLNLFGLLGKSSQKKQIDRVSNIQQHIRAIRHAENLDRQTHFRRSQVGQRSFQRFDATPAGHTHQMYAASAKGVNLGSIYSQSDLTEHSANNMEQNPTKASSNDHLNNLNRRVNSSTHPNEQAVRDERLLIVFKHLLGPERLDKLFDLIESSQRDYHRMQASYDNGNELNIIQAIIEASQDCLRQQVSGDTNTIDAQTTRHDPERPKESDTETRNSQNHRLADKQNSSICDSKLVNNDTKNEPNKRQATIERLVASSLPVIEAKTSDGANNNIGTAPQLATTNQPDEKKQLNTTISLVPLADSKSTIRRSRSAHKGEGRERSTSNRRRHRHCHCSSQHNPDKSVCRTGQCNQCHRSISRNSARSSSERLQRTPKLDQQRCVGDEDDMCSKRKQEQQQPEYSKSVKAKSQKSDHFTKANTVCENLISKPEVENIPPDHHHHHRRSKSSRHCPASTHETAAGCNEQQQQQQHVCIQGSNDNAKTNQLSLEPSVDKQTKNYHHRRHHHHRNYRRHNSGNTHTTDQLSTAGVNYTKKCESITDKGLSNNVNSYSNPQQVFDTSEHLLLCKTNDDRTSRQTNSIGQPRLSNIINNDASLRTNLATSTNDFKTGSQQQLSELNNNDTGLILRAPSTFLDQISDADCGREQNYSDTDNIRNRQQNELHAMGDHDTDEECVYKNIIIDLNN